MDKPTVFISYSHKDEEWKDRLVNHLGVLQSQGLLDLWDDRRIGAGEDWEQEIQEAMDIASVAVLLISPAYLTSEFLLRVEVPRLLERRKKEGLRIFPVIIKPCAWQTVGWLSRMQVRPADGHPLSAGDEHQIDIVLAAIAKEIRSDIRGGITSKPTVFISYRRKDEEWLERLVAHLKVWQYGGLFDVWDDRRIGAGEDWYQEIQEAMDAASVAVLLVSPAYLASEFLLRVEVPRLLERREKEGLRIFPIIVKPCAWLGIPWLARMQIRPQDGRPLSTGDEHQIDADLAAIATEMHNLLKSPTH